MKSIIAQIIDNMDEPDALTAVDIIRIFNKLFDALTLEDTDEAKRLINECGPENCDVFDQHVDAKIEYLTNIGELDPDSAEEEKDRIKNLFNELRKEENKYISEAVLKELGLMA